MLLPTLFGPVDVRHGATDLSGPVLLAVCDLEVSRGAIAVALELARAQHVRVEVVSIAEATHDSPTRDAWRSTTRDMLRRRPLRRVADVAAASGIPCTVTIGRGDPVSAVVERATAVGASLIVVGFCDRARRAAGLPDHMILRLRRRAQVPVLSIIPAVAGAPSIAVAAVDFTHSSLHAARAAATVLRPGGTLHLAHVAPDFSTATSRAVGLDLRYGKAVAASFGMMAKQLVVPEGVRVECVLLEGPAVEVLMGFVEGVAAELIAIGTTAGPLAAESSFTHLGSSLLRMRQRSILAAPASRAEYHGLGHES